MREELRREQQERTRQFEEQVRQEQQEIRDAEQREEERAAKRKEEVEADAENSDYPKCVGNSIQRAGGSVTDEKRYAIEADRYLWAGDKANYYFQSTGKTPPTITDVFLTASS